MKITICGSSAFKKEMIETGQELENLGHKPVIHPHYHAFCRGEMLELEELSQKEGSRAKKENDYIKWYYRAIAESDAILVLNLAKEDKKNYIGGNALIEMGFAHVLDKKIFLYNEPPADSPYLDEIEAVYDKVIHGDLTGIE